MHQVGVVGLSYRHALVDEVARFAVPRAELAARLSTLRSRLRAAEILYVSTCNRVEVVYATEDGNAAGDSRHEVFHILTGRPPAPGEAVRTLRAWAGEAAVEHLFLVACGLDSAQTGEQEIATQLRAAWEESRAGGTCGPVLDRLLGEALRMARQVQRMGGAIRAPSLGDLAAQRVRTHLQEHPGRVGLLGVSPMTRRCGLQLSAAGVPLLIINRTLDSAAQLAAELHVEVVSLDEFRGAPSTLSALVLAAGGGQALLDGAALGRLKDAGAPLLIDFGVPPNVDPADAQHTGLTRVGMSDLIEAAQGRRLAELVRLAPARAAIDERLNHLRSELATRAFGPRLTQLRGEFEQIAAEEVTRALAHELRTLDDLERGQVERLAQTLARRLAHLPLAGVKAAALHAGPDALDAFFEAARADRARATSGKP
jgi:glutamyl-tRNA reductase